jgi:hypothetical protein
MKLLNIETAVTRNFIPQILLNVQDFYFHKVGYTSYDESIFSPLTEHCRVVACHPVSEPGQAVLLANRSHNCENSGLLFHLTLERRQESVQSWDARQVIVPHN